MALANLKAQPLFHWLIPRLKQWFTQLRGVPESPTYLTWRRRFLRERLLLALWISLVGVFTFILRDLFNAIVSPLQEYQDLPESLVHFPLTVTISISLSLILCLVIYQTQFARQHPGAMFLCFSWSITLVSQIVGTYFRVPNPDLLGWSLIFLILATLIPVRWRLHAVAQLGTIAYYIIVNSLLGFTSIEGRSIYNVTLFLYIFWFCFICDLGVYLYERLQRSEFESRQQLQAFIHGISHDLRNPVTGSLMVLQNLLKSPESKVPVPRFVLERMVQGSDRQLSLINSLLETHMVDIQGISLRLEPLILKTLIEAAIADLEPLLHENQVSLNISVPDDLPLVNADPTQLWRVFGNLIANALKHNPPGLSLTIRATVDKLANQGFPLHTPEQDDMVCCHIEDNGVGMTKQQCDRLFELYFRSSSARSSLGLGLGLYLCRQIINAHGGQIGVNSSPNIGTTFWFTLPLFEAKP